MSDRHLIDFDPICSFWGDWLLDPMVFLSLEDYNIFMSQSEIKVNLLYISVNDSIFSKLLRLKLILR